MSSPDGHLRMSLRPCLDGIYLERWNALDGRGCLTQDMVFETEVSFLSWCDADDARFSYPLLCTQVRRAGRELFDRLCVVSER